MLGTSHQASHQSNSLEQLAGQIIQTIDYIKALTREQQHKRELQATLQTKLKRRFDKKELKKIYQKFLKETGTESKLKSENDLIQKELLHIEHKRNSGLKNLNQLVRKFFLRIPEELSTLSSPNPILKLLDLFSEPELEEQKLFQYVGCPFVSKTITPVVLKKYLAILLQKKSLVIESCIGNLFVKLLFKVGEWSKLEEKDCQDYLAAMPSTLKEKINGEKNKSAHKKKDESDEDSESDDDPPLMSLLEPAKAPLKKQKKDKRENRESHKDTNITKGSALISLFQKDEDVNQYICITLHQLFLQGHIPEALELLAQLIGTEKGEKLAWKIIPTIKLISFNDPIRIRNVQRLRRSLIVLLEKAKESSSPNHKVLLEKLLSITQSMFNEEMDDVEECLADLHDRLKTSSTKNKKSTSHEDEEPPSPRCGHQDQKVKKGKEPEIPPTAEKTTTSQEPSKPKAALKKEDEVKIEQPKEHTKENEEKKKDKMEECPQKQDAPKTDQPKKDQKEKNEKGKGKSEDEEMKDASKDSDHEEKEMSDQDANQDSAQDSETTEEFDSESDSDLLEEKRKKRKNHHTKKKAPSSSLQVGWNCFDVAIGLAEELKIEEKDPNKRAKQARAAVVQYALQRRGKARCRRLLRPEILNAVLLTAIYLNAQDAKEQNLSTVNARILELYNVANALPADERGAVQDQINALLDKQMVQSDEAPHFTHLLPKAMYERKEEKAAIQTLVNHYETANTQMQKSVTDNPNLFSHLLDHSVVSVYELDQFFKDEKNQQAHRQAYEYFQKSRVAILTHAEQALFQYCESVDTYTKYLQLYYGQNGWFAFQPFSNGTSMVDMAALFLNTRIVIHNEDGREIYRTQAEAEKEKHIAFNGVNHFFAYSEPSKHSPHKKQKPAAKTAHPKKPIKLVPITDKLLQKVGFFKAPISTSGQKAPTQKAATDATAKDSTSSSSTLPVEEMETKEMEDIGFWGEHVVYERLFQICHNQFQNELSRGEMKPEKTEKGFKLSGQAKGKEITLEVIWHNKPHLSNANDKLKKEPQDIQIILNGRTINLEIKTTRHTDKAHAHFTKKELNLLNECLSSNQADYYVYVVFNGGTEKAYIEEFKPTKTIQFDKRLVECVLRIDSQHHQTNANSSLNLPSFFSPQ